MKATCCIPLSVFRLDAFRNSIFNHCIYTCKKTTIDCSMRCPLTYCISDQSRDLICMSVFKKLTLRVNNRKKKINLISIACFCSLWNRCMSAKEAKPIRIEQAHQEDIR